MSGGATRQPAAHEVSRQRLLIGSAVRTGCGADDTDANAVLVERGRVLEVGRAVHLRRSAAAAAQEVDLGGTTLMPGLIDIHPHLMQHAVQLGAGVNLTDAVDHADILARLRAAADRTPAGEWIVATPIGEPFYFARSSYRTLVEGAMPDRRLLDAATTDHPVFIQAWAPTTPNIAAFNSAALNALGLDDDHPDRVGDVWFDRAADGTLTGIVRGTINQIYSFDSYWTELMARVRRPAPDLLRLTRGAMRTYNGRGVTTVYEPHNMTPDFLEAYRILNARRELTVRVGISMEVEMTARAPVYPKSMAAFEASLEARAGDLDAGDDFLSVMGLTLGQAGGPSGPGHLLMSEPYPDPYGNPTYGTRFLTDEKFVRFAEFCVQRGIRANFVATGYGDHEAVLQALERPQIASAITDQSWVIQHAALITPEQTRRYARLGVDVTTCPGFQWGQGASWRTSFGAAAMQNALPLARFLREGIRVAGGSDWGPKNAFEQIMLAETHAIEGDHANDGSDQTIDREAAMDMWLGAGAHVLRRPDLGWLGAGAAADVIAVDRDPWTCPIEELSSTQTLAAYVAGDAVSIDA